MVTGDAEEVDDFEEGGVYTLGQKVFGGEGKTAGAAVEGEVKVVDAVKGAVDDFGADEAVGAGKVEAEVVEFAFV